MSQVFILTGAASGMGRHLAGALARRGHRVLATDVAAAALDEAARADRWPDESVRRAVLDVRSDEAWRVALATALDAFGRVDVLLNVAGFLRPGRIWATETKDVDLHFDVNVKGVVHGMRVVGGYFVEQKRGHIVNLGSLASLAPVPGLTLYSASKFAVRGVSLAAAQELAEHGVSVSLVMPDAVATPMLDLQVDHPEAALTFSGPKPLTVQDIEEALVNDVLVNKPLELALPWQRGFVARIANTVPRSAAVLRPILERKGREAQNKFKKSPT